MFSRLRLQKMLILVQIHMTKIESNSDQTASTAKNFFVPSFGGAVLFLLIGGLLLLAYCSSQIINWLGSNYLESANKLTLNFNILNNGLSDSFSSAFGGRLGLIILWSVIGAIAYIALWFLRNLLNSFENDVIIDHYTHPSNYSRAGYWGSAMAGKIFFAAITVVFIVYTFLALKVFMPAVAALTRSAATDFQNAKSVGYILLCVLISTLIIYIWTLVARTLAHLWKLL